jgi:dTDP-4-amino-4,6-dideoxygalactose transaminase
MDAIDAKYLVLPLHMGMGTEDVERVCGVIKEGW